MKIAPGSPRADIEVIWGTSGTLPGRFGPSPGRSGDALGTPGRRQREPGRPKIGPRTLPDGSGTSVLWRSPKVVRQGSFQRRFFIDFSMKKRSILAIVLSTFCDGFSKDFRSLFVMFFAAERAQRQTPDIEKTLPAVGRNALQSLRARAQRRSKNVPRTIAKTFENRPKKR